MLKYESEIYVLEKKFSFMLIGSPLLNIPQKLSFKLKKYSER